MSDIDSRALDGANLHHENSFSESIVSGHSEDFNGTDEDGVEDEESWEDVQPDVEEISFKSFFDDQSFQDVHSMLEHCRKTYDFDLLKIKRDFALDFLELIKLVNYIRAEANRGINKPNVSHKRFFEDEQYLQPVLEDDALLYSLDELDVASEAIDCTEAHSPSTRHRSCTQDEMGGVKQGLEAKLNAFRDFYQLQQRKAYASAVPRQFRRTFGRRALDRAVYRRQSEPDIGSQSYDHLLSRESLDSSVEPQHSAMNPSEKSLPAIPPGSSLNSSKNQFTADAQPTLPENTILPNPPENDSHYMEAYAQIDIHETMLKDSVRTNAYKTFIYSNPGVFKDKTVLDVGCGSGILALFCAKAGAKKVYAVDQSDILYRAREIVHENGFSDVITCIRGKMEYMNGSDIPQVDIIISEWMGYGLLYESMLDSVLFARDHFLRPDGLMVPSFARLHIAPVQDQEYAADKVNYWSDVYGFNMSAMASQIYRNAIMHDIPQDAVVGSSSTFLNLNLHTCTKLDLEFTKQFEILLTKDIENLTGFGVWFTVEFDVPGALNAHSSLTTSPFEPSTHWLQTYLMIDPKTNAAGALAVNTKITGTVSYAKCQSNAREVEVCIGWKVAYAEDGTGEANGRQTWMIT